MEEGSNAAFDITESIAALAQVETNLIAVGGTIIGLAVVAVGFKWIKGMLFG